jgi:hypothetical protein
LLFLDGVGGNALARAEAAGRIRFLPALRDGPAYRLTPAFSGMPSTTAAFQAGLFFGVRHPDIPAFSWMDRTRGKRVRMNAPKDSEMVEERLVRTAGPGLMNGGHSYVSILRGGADNRLNSVGLAHFLAPPERLPPAADMPGLAIVQLRSMGLAGLHALAAVGGFLWDTVPAGRWMGTRRHEWRYLLNWLGVATLGQELSMGQLLLDLLRGVPRMFLCLHDYDERSHRRGPADADLYAMPRLDLATEMIFALAEAAPDPPDVWVITDHGQIPSIPCEKLLGCTIADWLGHAEARELPPGLRRIFGEPGPLDGPPPEVVDCGDYAHVYLQKGPALQASQIVRDHAHVLGRALACPAVGLVAMRHDGGAVAVIGDRIVDPKRPETVPKGASPHAVAALLEELAHSPSAGDLVLYGTWIDDACVAFSWELSSHGGPSPEETTTFVIHPANVPEELLRAKHGADLFHLLSHLYPATTIPP